MESTPHNPDNPVPIPQTASELLPLVYNELRRLAAARMAQERPGQTLQATALVHEAWLRLGKSEHQLWRDQAHFFAAAAESMRRILIESARRKQSLQRGGMAQKISLVETDIAAPLPDDQLLALDEAIDALACEDPKAAQLVKLRFFVGLSHREAADLMGLNRTAADRTWVYARAWLAQAMRQRKS